MNYTGFGQDPFNIYSFRGERPQEGLGLMMKDEGIKSLRESLAYKQAGMEGKGRMERAVGMGLPPNTDLNRVQQVGYDPTRQQPIYAAPRPQPFGTWGSFGGGKERNEPVPTPQPPEGGGGPQPAQGTGAPFTAPERSLGTSASSPLSFTGFGRTIGESAYRTPTIPSTVPSPIPRGTTETLTGFGGVPRFPFAGY
jgi:hypothetical protein